VGGEGQAAGARTYFKVMKRRKQSKERGDGGDVGVGWYRHICAFAFAWSLARRLHAVGSSKQRRSRHPSDVPAELGWGDSSV
jgi:hypothetical protein